MVVLGAKGSIESSTGDAALSVRALARRRRAVVSSEVAFFRVDSRLDSAAAGAGGDATGVAAGAGSAVGAGAKIAEASAAGRVAALEGRFQRKGMSIATDTARARPGSTCIGLSLRRSDVGLASSLSVARTSKGADRAPSERRRSWCDRRRSTQTVPGGGGIFAVE